MSASSLFLQSENIRYSIFHLVILDPPTTLIPFFTQVTSPPKNRLVFSLESVFFFYDPHPT